MMPHQSFNNEAVSNRHKLLELLADGRFHSGQELGRTLSVSRAAIWKSLRSLAACGLSITSVKGRGYCLECPMEFLSRARLLETLDHRVVDGVSKLTVFTEVDSTNQFLLDRINQADFHGHVVLAEYQSAGRGRHGNLWLSPYGSGISLSLGWEFTTPPAAMGIISLALGVAVVETLCEFGINNVGLKWPNDILHNRDKLGGILVEMRGELAGPSRLVMGIGINYSLPRKQALVPGRKVTDIAAIADPLPSRNVFTARLVSRIMEMLMTFDNSRIPNLLERWRQHDCIKGETVTLETAGGPIMGEVAGIDESGSLLLRVNDQVKSYTSGEISLRLGR
ncbi:MAG TPA: biotin--[acetyl-CoA-carboxylase] ligase [Gammaproteobacteria bacterium]|nr:biotin--[acetyl-CoA-carboxylase] ligase [Gammaproteobacteria bacterium]